MPFTDFAFDVVRRRQLDRGHRRRPAAARVVVRVDAATGKAEVLRRELDELPDEDYLPVPRPVELEGPYGRVVHALVYPPSSPDAHAARPARAPPYVVWVHGGPTGHVTAAARPGEGLLHQPRHRRHRRQLRRLDRLRPLLPRAAAPPVGHRGRGGRDGRRPVAGRRGRGRPEAAGHPRRVGGRLDRAGRRDHRRTAAPARCSARRRPTTASSDLRGFAGPDARLRVALPGRAARPAAGLRGGLRRARPGRARDRRAPARCCCSRAWTTRSCRPPSPRASPPTWPSTASGTPTWPSRASRTASAGPRP